MKNAQLLKMERVEWYWYFHVQLFLHIAQVAYQFRIILDYDFGRLEDQHLQAVQKRTALQAKIDKMLVKDEEKAKADIWDARDAENEAKEKLDRARENCLPIEFEARRTESKEKKEWTFVKLFVFDDKVAFKIVEMRWEIHNYNLSISEKK